MDTSSTQTGSVRRQDGRSRVVFYNHTGRVSGAERMLLLTIGHLPASYEAVLICPAEGPLREEAALLGAQWHEVPTANARFTLNPFHLVRYLGSLLNAIGVVRRTIRELSPDLIHANSPRAGIIAMIATMGSDVSIVWHVHDILPPHPLSNVVRLAARLSRRNRLAACSAAAAESFESAAGNPTSRPAAVLHNGIETERFIADPECGSRVRRSLEIGATSFVIGIIGQVTPRKGHLGLIRAFARFKDSVPNAVLAVIGTPIFDWDHEYQARLNQEVDRLGLNGHVRFLGHHRHPAEIMQMLDVVVVNSLVEPFGLVIVEAMAMGKPVIATRSGGPSEIIEHERNGYLIPVNDDQALTSALVMIAESPVLRQQYREAGPAHVRAHFSAESYISRLTSFYSQVLPLSSRAQVQHPGAPALIAAENESHI